MAVRHNRISQKELKRRLREEIHSRITLSFYKYFPVSDTTKFRDELYHSLQSFGVFGRIYIAPEGINAQISVPLPELDNVEKYLRSVDSLSGIRLNQAINDNGKSFWVLKIKIREKIVADGISDPSFSLEKIGTYVDAATFNRLSDEDGTVIVDMRNHYEYEVGHFENATEIPSDTFREQLPMAVDMLKEKKEKNIVLYCTGGIRCEKASAYLKHHGFKNVFHLDGGIIHYCNTVRELSLPNKFHGKNFVFDDRLGEKITREVISRCHQCGQPADNHTNCRNEGCHLLFIQCDKCAIKFEGCCSVECQKFIQLPEKERGIFRKGINKGRNVFNKSRKRLTSSTLNENHDEMLTPAGNKHLPET
ncbi:MAG TPA: rhodanese-related sulfurtransferase [Puia sp.]|nr:rhodanese-related sulfurtransferase [Puia sp.]